MEEKKTLAEWAMEPVPGYECRAQFFDDGSAEFFDEPARRRENDKGSAERRVLFALFSEDDRHLSDEVCRHTKTFRIPDALLHKIIAANNEIQLSDSGEVLRDIPARTQ